MVRVNAGKVPRSRSVGFRHGLTSILIVTYTTGLLNNYTDPNGMATGAGHQSDHERR